MNLNPTEKKVLTYLAGSYCEDFGYSGFQGICKRTKLPRNKVRLACRSLKRKGLAAFSSGLWNDDGQPAGSGYSASREGVAFIEAQRASAHGECVGAKHDGL